jgi:putative ABC transport system permease protein
MGLLTMLIRKMFKNRWLIASLLAGMILSSALASSLPIYKDAIVLRMMHKEFEQYYMDSGSYPGSIHAFMQLIDIPEEDRFEKIKLEEERFAKRFVEAYSDILIGNNAIKETVAVRWAPADPARLNPKTDRYAPLIMRKDLEAHIELVDGRLPAKEPANGVIEAVVIDRSLGDLEVVVGSELVTKEEKYEANPVHVRVVGVVREKSPEDLYWNGMPLSRHVNQFIVDESIFESYRESSMPVSFVRLLAQYEYTQLDLSSAAGLFREKESYNAHLKQAVSLASNATFPAESVLAQFAEQENRLATLLWSLSVPIFVLIAFYLYMVSSLLIDRQRAEISVLRSRGAGKFQISLVFAMESALLASVAFLIGPWVGAWFTRIIGSSNTFLGFVQRKALRVEITPESLLYAGLAVIAALAINLLPVIMATRFSIVAQKRKAAREGKSVWHTFGLDFICIALALYGYSTFRRRVDDLVGLGLGSNDLTIDPLLFMVPSLFILGTGLLLLRIYPWIVRLIYYTGRRYWAPSMYASLLLVSRRSGNYHAIMLFLILTLGTGIFHASAAMTLNRNIEEQISYGSGADIVLTQRWIDDTPPPVAPGGAEPSPSGSAVNYLEPDFERWRNMPGVEAAAKVYVNEEGMVWHKNSYIETVTLYGIDTDDFGQTAWMKHNLLPHHFYEYLNLISQEPGSVLISKTMADSYGVQVGDSIQLSWEGRNQMTAVVYGIIDYFPAFNPNPPAGSTSVNRPPMLVVGHLSAFQNNIALEPYRIWLKLQSPEERSGLFQAIRDNRITLTSLTDTIALLQDSRNDPFRMAMNGVMSLSFILSLLISFVGFLLYWGLSMKGRTLQLGVMRAMGLSFRSMLGMLSGEQLLTSGAGIGFGVAAGSAASLVFVPMFQLSFDPGQIVPPFEIMLRAADSVPLFVLTGVMLGLALFMLAMLLRTMKIHQAVKLGED